MLIRETLPPWLDDVFRQLYQLEERRSLPHALLLAGPPGLGKELLARIFTAGLLCGQPQGGQACAQCAACQLLAAGSHPGIRELCPQEESSQIRIEQVRSCIEFLNKTAMRGSRKIVLLHPAEALNINSANALLKSLEEPAAGTLLVLISHQPGLLLPTIRSRCQTIKFSKPQKAEVLPWLQARLPGDMRAETLLALAGGAPLRALSMLEDGGLEARRQVLHSLTALARFRQHNVEAAAECATFNTGLIIENMQLLLAELCHHVQTGAHAVTAEDEAEDTRLLKQQVRKQGIAARQLHRFYQRLLAARQAISGQSNPNKVLLLESLFHQWQLLLAASPSGEKQ